MPGYPCCCNPIVTNKFYPCIPAGGVPGDSLGPSFKSSLTAHLDMRWQLAASAVCDTTAPDCSRADIIGSTGYDPLLDSSGGCNTSWPFYNDGSGAIDTTILPNSTHAPNDPTWVCQNASPFYIFTRDMYGYGVELTCAEHPTTHENVAYIGIVYFPSGGGIGPCANLMGAYLSTPYITKGVSYSLLSGYTPLFGTWCEPLACSVAFTW
jgi:hypothetical protein